MSGGRRIGILGGTFNPLHIGHLIMAESAFEQLSLDEVVFAPAGDPPHKASDGIVSAVDRLTMVELAIAGRPGFTSSRIDMLHPGPSYTWRLLERCRERWPEAEFWFIIGSDSLREFGAWARPERILELSRIAMIERPGHPADAAAIEAVPELRERLDPIDTPMCSVSASDLRTRVEQGRSIRYLVPDDVRHYIYKHRLFRESVDADE